MCSMCPISCWAALFYCSVINPEICPNCHIFHCSDAYATAVFKLRIMCFKVIDTKTFPFILGHWHMSNALNNTNNSSVRSVNFIITAAQGINKFSLCWDAMSILSLKQCPAARVERWHAERVKQRLSVALIFPSIRLHVSTPVCPHSSNDQQGVAISQYGMIVSSQGRRWWKHCLHPAPPVIKVLQLHPVTRCFLMYLFLSL